MSANGEPIRVQGQEPDAEDHTQEELEALPKIKATSMAENGLDMGDLDEQTLDPEFHYRWIHNSPAKIAKRLRRQWTFVRKSEDKVEKLIQSEEGADDFIRNGDTILMKISKDLHDTMKKRIATVTRSRLTAPKGQFRKKARESGYNPTGSGKSRGEPSD